MRAGRFHFRGVPAGVWSPMTFSLPGAGKFRVCITDARGPVPVYTAPIFGDIRGESWGAGAAFMDGRL